MIALAPQKGQWPGQALPPPQRQDIISLADPKRHARRDSAMRAALHRGNTVWGVTLSVALVYLLFTLAALWLHGGNPYWFVWLGERYVSGIPGGSIGYDGQFVYAIALEGLAAGPLLDNPPYRLQRILLPLLLRLLSGARPARLAWLMPLVNWGAIVGATYLLARWLTRQGLSPWYALTYAGYVGTLMAFSRNLIEPLLGLLAIAGVLAWQEGRLGRAALLLALAMLTKETALLFPAALGAHALWQRRHPALAWLGASMLPLLAWQAVLYRTYGVWALRAGPALDPVPLRGILRQLSWEPGRLSALLFVALPALVLTIWAFWRLRKEPETLGLWLVLFQAVPVLLMPAAVHDHIMHAGRNALGLVIGAVLAMPCASARARQFALAYWVAPSLAWLIPILRWAPWTLTAHLDAVSGVLLWLFHGRG
jgi:hypothetical protein